MCLGKRPLSMKKYVHQIGKNRKILKKAFDSRQSKLFHISYEDFKNILK